MNLIGIDPGGTTGLAVWSPDKRGHPDLSSGPYVSKSMTKAHGDYWFIQVPTNTDAEYHDFGKFLVYLVDGMCRMDDTMVVLEDFDFRQDDGVEFGGKAGRPKIEYMSAEIVGVVKYLSIQHRFSMTKQNAGTGKAFWDDDKIKRCELWWPGHKHSMDALRHLLRYRTFVMNDQTMLYELRED